MGGCGVGHGQSGKALHSVRAVISQLDGPSLCDCNCVFNGMDGEDRDSQSELW